MSSVNGPKRIGGWRFTPGEAIGVALDVQRKTGRRIGRVEEIALMPLAEGECGHCGKPCRFISVKLCDDCLPPEPTCDTCGAPADCYAYDKGDRCGRCAREDWGW
jgi:hypothetical protein